METFDSFRENTSNNSQSFTEYDGLSVNLINEGSNTHMGIPKSETVDFGWYVATIKNVYKSKTKNGDDCVYNELLIKCGYNPNNRQMQYYVTDQAGKRVMNQLTFNDKAWGITKRVFEKSNIPCPNKETAFLNAEKLINRNVIVSIYDNNGYVNRNIVGFIEVKTARA